jgi:hypothetical protein
MLRYLLPSAAIVALCLAIYGTSLNVLPVDNGLTLVPVVPQPQPTARPPEAAKPTAPTINLENERIVMPVLPGPLPTDKPPEQVTITAPATSVEQAAPQPPEPKPARDNTASRPDTAQSIPVHRQRPLQADLGPVPARTPPSIRGTPRPPSIQEQLLSARAALAGNNPLLARDLLEAAETTVVFQPGDRQQSRTSIAAAQITQALRKLNTGDRDQALQHVGQALAAVQPEQ